MLNRLVSCVRSIKGLYHFGQGSSDAYVERLLTDLNLPTRQKIKSLVALARTQQRMEKYTESSQNYQNAIDLINQHKFAEVSKDYDYLKTYATIYRDSARLGASGARRVSQEEKDKLERLTSNSIICRLFYLGN